MYLYPKRLEFTRILNESIVPTLREIESICSAGVSALERLAKLAARSSWKYKHRLNTEPLVHD